MNEANTPQANQRIELFCCLWRVNKYKFFNFYTILLLAKHVSVFSICLYFKLSYGLDSFQILFCSILNIFLGLWIYYEYLTNGKLKSTEACCFAVISLVKSVSLYFMYVYFIIMLRNSKVNLVYLYKCYKMFDFEHWGLMQAMEVCVFGLIVTLCAVLFWLNLVYLRMIFSLILFGSVGDLRREEIVNVDGARNMGDVENPVNVENGQDPVIDIEQQRIE